MRNAPAVRFLCFALVMLAISAASFAQIGIAIRIGPPFPCTSSLYVPPRAISGRPDIEPTTTITPITTGCLALGCWLRNIHNVYNTTVISNVTVNRVSYNGGNGGINARPTPEQEEALRDRHIPPIAAQEEHMRAAQADRELRASVNHGRPTIAASPRPGAFRERGVVPAREAGAPYNPGGNRNGAEQREPQGNFPHPGNGVHPGDLPAHERPGAPNTGNQKLDQKYQQQQEKLSTRQNQEHQKLQQKQEQNHQRMARQNANDARRQQVEQHHQQQTQQMEQRHVQQQQHLEQKQQPRRQNGPRPH